MKTLEKALIRDGSLANVMYAKWVKRKLRF